MKRGAAPHARFKTIPNAILLAVAVAVTLEGLRFLAGSYNHLIFWRLIFSQDISAAWLSVLLTCLAAFLARFRAPNFAPNVLFETTARWVDGRIHWLWLATFPLYGAFSFWVSRGRAFAADEATVRFQSEVFASGHLTARVPPELLNWLIPSASQGHFWHVSHASGTLISSFWPGSALVMAPFAALGAPWLCNPFLTALTLWAIHRLARQVSGSPVAALWATLFTAASPVVALNATTYFSMPAHLLFNALFALLLVRQTPGGALWAGVVGGWALLLGNPVPHASFALPWMGYLLRRRRDLLWRALVGYLCLGLPLLLTWSLYLGSFDASYHVLAYEARGASAGPLVDILARLRVAFAPPSLAIWIARLAGMSKLVVWAVPALPVLAWGGAKIARHSLANSLVSGIPSGPLLETRWLRLLIASFWTTFAIFLFVRFDQGAGWGFRYLHSAWLALPLLAALFLIDAPRLSSGVSVRRFAAFCLLLSALILTPYRALQVRGFLGREFEQIPDVSAPAALFFIDLKNNRYGDSLIANDPFLRNSQWKLVHRGDAADARLARGVLLAPRLIKRGKWGQIWVGSGFTPRYSRSLLN